MASLLFHDEPKLYAEKDYWSQQHMIWKKMLVKKPRLPTSKELTPDKSTPRWRDDKALWPPAFLLFSGKHNEGTIQALVKICEEFEDDKRSPPSLVIYGAKGSGKTAMAHILIQEFCTELEVSDSQKQKWILLIDAAQHTENFSAMWDMVKKFIEPPQDRFLRNVGFRIVVVDNADILPVSAQQTLRKLMDTFLPVAHFVFVCADINKITQYVKDLSVKLRSRAMGEQDSLAWIVKFLFRRNIGFNREGIQLLFKICKDRSLTDMLNVLQDVFVQRHFISLENIVTVYKDKKSIKIDPPEMPFTRVIEPLQRCKICTLFPPCSHTNLETLTMIARERRNELPFVAPIVVKKTVKKGGIRSKEPSVLTAATPTAAAAGLKTTAAAISATGTEAVPSIGGRRSSTAPPSTDSIPLCMEYVRYGKCTSFNELGRCRCNHPKKIHKIMEDPRRCTRCTIPWPCDHCSYHADRNHLLLMIENIKTRLKKLKTANVDEPPMSLRFFMEELDPQWREIIRTLDAEYGTSLKVDTLNGVVTWLETSFATDSFLYIRKESFLDREFGELLESDLLEDPKIVKKRTENT